MSARERYKSVFGELTSLADKESWTTEVSNMLEWLCWDTRNILGVSKTTYRRKIVELTHHEFSRKRSLDEQQKYVEAFLASQMNASQKDQRYAGPQDTIASATEALRRAKYFSENYLNKEFDIFWTLVSNQYLDKYYSQFTEIVGGGEWTTHGNSGLFENNTGIIDMQMDNLSFNAKEKILVANELKLGGKKNPDQILKYSLMCNLLIERGFMPRDSRFLLLFIGDKKESDDWESTIESEIKYCQSSPKTTSKIVIKPEIVGFARSAEYAASTWNDMIQFNKKYRAGLDPKLQQVEQKLIWGFNEALSSKAFMVRRNGEKKENQTKN